MEIHQNSWNLLKASEDILTSKPPFETAKNGETFINVLDVEAKRMVLSIEQSGILYTTVLKYPKWDYGNPTVVSYLKLNALFDQPQLPAKNKPPIRSFQQHLKTCVIWLSSVAYQSAIWSTDKISKAVTRLPNYLPNKFYKESKGNDSDKKR